MVQALKDTCKMTIVLTSETSRAMQIVAVVIISILLVSHFLTLCSIYGGITAT